MTREERLEYCKICTNRKMTMKQGLVCGLTNALADFDGSCKDFNRDDEAEQIEFERKMAATGDYETGDPIDYKKNKKVGAIIFVIGSLITLVTHLYIDDLGVAIVTYGTIIYGASQYYRGMQQEKIAKQRENRKG